MAILAFIAKLVVSSGLLYGYYHFFLRNKRFHHYNRFYLLAISCISLVIPFINIPVNLFWSGQQHSTLIQTLKVINANDWEEPVTVYAQRNFWSQWLSIQNGLYLVYTAGVLTGLFLLVRSLAWIKQLKQKYNYENIEQLKIYSTTEPGTPFSFFRNIFWDENISFNDKRGQQIFRHEMFHVKEKHSADVLFLEILCCTCWFNPFYHLIKKEIRAIHEFLADEYAISANNRYDYAELLVAHAITQRKLNLTNPFFHNQIKRRITMITQSNLIRRSGYISRIMALPLLFLLVSAFAVKLSSSKPVSTPASHYANKTITVVIDPGHGGIYPGAHSNNNVAEKDITLSIAKKIKAISPEYNINVVLTRTTDELVGNATDLRQDLMNRVQITKDAKSDLFVSVHLNGTPENITTRSGFEAYLSGRTENAKDEGLASAIIATLKDIYYVDETIKRREVGVQVLDKKLCPGVLLECGYITNPKDEAFIIDPANQEKVARKILEGIVKYSNAQTAIRETGTAEFVTKPDGAPEFVTKSDLITPEALSKLNVDDVKSVNADMKKTTGTVYFKNGNSKSFNTKEVNDYYTVNHIEGELQGYVTNVNMKDSLVDIKFVKDTVPGANDKTITFTKVEIEAEYQGGTANWSNYLTKNLHYPPAALKKNVEGTVVVEFIIDAKGKVSDVKAISGPEDLKAESIRIVKESGVWTSAVQNGKKVRAYKRQPISYKLS